MRLVMMALVVAACGGKQELLATSLAYGGFYLPVAQPVEAAAAT